MIGGREAGRAGWAGMEGEGCGEGEWEGEGVGGRGRE